MATVSFTSGDLLGADETAEYTAASSHCESAVTPSSSSPRMGAVGEGVPPAAAAAWAWAAASLNGGVSFSRTSSQQVASTENR